VSALRSPSRKPPRHRKPRKSRRPSKITVTVAGTAAVATIAVASGVAAAAPETPASKAAPPGPAAAMAASASDATRQVARLKIHLAVLEKHRLAAEAAEARRAAARREARRREARRQAAARRAAERAAARQAQQSAGSSASAPAAPSGSPQQIAAAMLGSFGWSSSEFGCLQSLWNAESGWNPSASNPISGAYGIPQALPGSKMASAGPDWQSNPATQIKWGLGYIKQVYGSPCAAWSHEQSTGWY
jgi:hypothetical protein